MPLPGCLKVAPVGAHRDWRPGVVQGGLWVLRSVAEHLLGVGSQLLGLLCSLVHQSLRVAWHALRPGVL